MKNLKQKGKFIAAILFIAGLSINANAQCFKVQKGQNVTSVTNTYDNLLPATVKKWAKLKPTEREELILAQNKEYESGAKMPSSVYKSNFTITNFVENEVISAYTIEESAGVFEYKTTNYCIDDTLYFVRNKDVIYSILKGDTVGYGLQGIQKIPVNIKVGDILPSYRDFGMTKPKTSTITASEKVNTGRTETVTKIRSGYFQDSETGEHGIGTYKETTKKAIYETIYHDVEMATSLNFLTINYFTAVVTGEEEIKIGDKTMNAFVIESENWIKSTFIQDFQAENNKIEEQQRVKAEKLKEKMDKQVLKIGYTNEDGYTVIYKTEWFVPGYGIVAAETYDIYGGIQSKTQTIFE